MPPSYIPFASAPPQNLVENRGKPSCWHLLTVSLTILSAFFASFLLVKSSVSYLNADHYIEECTVDWNAHFTCHYLWLWVKFHGNSNVFDTRCFFAAFCLFVISVSAQLLVSYRVINFLKKF